MSNILNDTKQVLGLLETETAFDVDILMHINTVFSVMNQLGVTLYLTRPVAASDDWDAFVDHETINSVKTYVFLRVKLFFDPPTTGFTQAAYERQIQELEFRLNVDNDAFEHQIVS